jgi:hypothetical protein
MGPDLYYLLKANGDLVEPWAHAIQQAEKYELRLLAHGS